jgi:hypothetical protein
MTAHQTSTRPRRLETTDNVVGRSTLITEGRPL